MEDSAYFWNRSIAIRRVIKNNHSFYYLISNQEIQDKIVGIYFERVGSASSERVAYSNHYWRHGAVADSIVMNGDIAK